MINRLKTKLNESGGETLAETLVALAIGVFAMIVLPAAVAAASKITRNAMDTYTTGDRGDGSAAYTAVDLSISSTGFSADATTSPKVKVYTGGDPEKAASVYYYYEYEGTDE